MDNQLTKLNDYVKNSENSFVSEVFDYISDRSLEYTNLEDCIEDVLKDPNGLLLTDDEYIDLYNNFSDEIVAYINSDEFSNLFKKLPSVKEYKITLAKYAIECGLINFIDAIDE